MAWFFMIDAPLFIIVSVIYLGVSSLNFSLCECTFSWSIVIASNVTVGSATVVSNRISANEQVLL